jgi:hypothetical protein
MKNYNQVETLCVLHLLTSIIAFEFNWEIVGWALLIRAVLIFKKMCIVTYKSIDRKYFK